MSITQDRVRELLHYDPETGVILWRSDRIGGPGGMIAAGTVAGCIKDKDKPNPYRVLWLDGRLYRAHRVVWLYVHGRWPAQGLDHRDGDGLNNRLGNLRECNQQQNNGNHKRLNRTNTSGHRGVTWRKDKGKWKAYINRNDRQVHLGYFVSKDEAIAAYKAAAVAHFGEFARL